MPKAKDNQPQNAIITAFPLQEWLHEHASLLCSYKYCLSCFLLYAMEVVTGKLHDIEISNEVGIISSGCYKST